VGRWDWVFVLGGDAEDVDVVEGDGANCRGGCTDADGSGSISIKLELSTTDDDVVGGGWGVLCCRWWCCRCWCWWSDGDVFVLLGDDGGVE